MYSKCKETENISVLLLFKKLSKNVLKMQNSSTVSMRAWKFTSEKEKEKKLHLTRLLLSYTSLLQRGKRGKIWKKNLNMANVEILKSTVGLLVAITNESKNKKTEDPTNFFVFHLHHFLVGMLLP